MHINALDYDILRDIFATISTDYDLRKSQDYKQLVELSSTCRYWRSLLLPYLYEKVYVEGFCNAETKSNAKLCHSNDFVNHAHIFEIHLNNVFIDSYDFVSALKASGITETIWPNIKTLEIESSIGYFGNWGVYYSDALEAEQVAEVFSKHLPRVKEVRCVQRVENSQWERSSLYPCHVATELARLYSAQLCKVDLSIFAGCLSTSYFLPHVLTHLDIDLNTAENEILMKISAPSLQYLKLSCVSEDIEWDWFDSGNGSDIWFSKLLELEVDFDIFEPHPLSHQKRVHFPVLRKLKVTDYPYYDGRFYKLFENCPLREIDIYSPIASGHCIPPQLLAGLRAMNIHIQHDNLWLERSEPQHISERMEYERSIAKLMSTPSTAFSARLSTRFSKTLSLPDTIAWNLAQRLVLELSVDMQSIYVILAQMPRLRRLELGIRSEHLIDGLGGGGISTCEHDKQHLAPVNKCVECIVLKTDGMLAKRSLEYLLSGILPSVPSLLLLKINRPLVEGAKDIVCELANSLKQISQRLEISHY